MQEIKSVISAEEAEKLVLENQGWAESVARSVARAWNLDAEQDGLLSAAFEALIFCSRRFDPKMGVPFRGYSRKRIHEAATEESRRSKNWKSGISPHSKGDHKQREISSQLLDLFPDLRDGHMPFLEQGMTDDIEGVRLAIRQLLVGASLLASRQGMAAMSPEEAFDCKKMIEVAAELDLMHQVLLWKTYWEGLSLRSVATEWETDELNVMREHKAVLTYLFKALSANKINFEKPKIRPALRIIAQKLKKEMKDGPFTQALK